MANENGARSPILSWGQITCAPVNKVSSTLLPGRGTGPSLPSAAASEGQNRLSCSCDPNDQLQQGTRNKGVASLPCSRHWRTDDSGVHSLSHSHTFRAGSPVPRQQSAGPTVLKEQFLHGKFRALASIADLPARSAERASVPVGRYVWVNHFVWRSAFSSIQWAGPAIHHPVFYDAISVTQVPT